MENETDRCNFLLQDISARLKDTFAGLIFDYLKDYPNFNLDELATYLETKRGILSQDRRTIVTDFRDSIINVLDGNSWIFFKENRETWKINYQKLCSISNRKLLKKVSKLITMSNLAISGESEGAIKETKDLLNKLRCILASRISESEESKQLSNMINEGYLHLINK